MDEFLEDLKSGEIKFHDRWQFELKSEFSPSESSPESTYTQEFYFFVPNDLEIRPETYSKEDFYFDIINFIRYKTPPFAFKELLDRKNRRSPLYRLKEISLSDSNGESHDMATFELKLFGNIFRSALRERILKIIISQDSKDIIPLCHEIQAVRERFFEVEKSLFNSSVGSSLKATLTYSDEFIRTTIDYYLTGLLYEFRKNKTEMDQKTEDTLIQLIIHENEPRDKMYHAAFKERSERSEVVDEYILYRSSLLNKFVIDALMLPVDRFSLKEIFGNLIASFSAAIAMLFYVLLVVWQGQWFLINSLPFIVITVVAYVLKDRVKEGLKTLSYRQTLRFFPDYTTKILSPLQRQVIGLLKESFTFVNPNNVPIDIYNIRNQSFHIVMEKFKRPEQIIYFKRVVKIYSSSKKRLRDLNIILRFNIRKFLEKASDPYHSYVTINPDTRSLISVTLPKVYHLNVIMKNTFTDENEMPAMELKNFRIILDKNGIKNIEKVAGE